VKENLEWLKELNPQQKLAVTHGPGPILVIAGAGSGKTRTLAYRVAYLIATGVSPARILLLTFTRRAAEEMLRRATAAARLDQTVGGSVWGGTFHAVANRLLRIYGGVLGLSKDFTIMDEEDSEDLLNLLRHQLGYSSARVRFPQKATLRAIYSRCVNGNERLKTVLEKYFPWCLCWEKQLKILFRKYVERKQEKQILDYDDLLLYWEQLLSDDRIADEVGGRFDYILVDEYQDTNIIQGNILRKMRKKNKNIMVVGDDAQSIYSFRGATVRNILDFPKHFPGATVITLEQNYRSTMPILEVTNAVISQAQERFTKNLWSKRHSGQRPLLVTCFDESYQDNFVADTIMKHHQEGIPLHRQAVLFRAGYHSDSLEVELARRNIPFHKYGGLRFLETAHVKDLLGFLRIMENPRDELSWFRILQLLPGIGPATAALAMEYVWQHNYDPALVGKFEGPQASREELKSLGGLFRKLKNFSGQPASQVEQVRLFYQPFLIRLYENAPARQRDLENLEKIATRYESLGSFLTDLTLDPPASTSDLAGASDKNDDWLVLSTIHSAKGCEWDVVILIHASDGCLPSDMSTGSEEEVEEELRLTYVAMTRARDYLYVTWPLRYYRSWSRFTDKHIYAQRSRFLSDRVCEKFEQLAVGPEEDSEVQLKTITDWQKRLKSRWF